MEPKMFVGERVYHYLGSHKITGTIIEIVAPPIKMNGAILATGIVKVQWDDGDIGERLRQTDLRKEG